MKLNELKLNSFQKDKILSYLSSFQKFSHEEKEMIASSFNVKHFREGDFLFPGEKACNDYFFVAAGVVRITAPDDEGRDITYFFIGEGQLCTILDSFNAGTVTQNRIQACCAAEILVINKNTLVSLLTKIPSLGNVLDQINQHRLLDKIRLKNAFAGKDSASRYKLFLSLQPDIAYRVPLNHIASYLDVTPQSLSRIRRNVK